MYHVSCGGGDSGLYWLTSSRVWIPAEFWADCGGQFNFTCAAFRLAHHLEYLFCGVGGYHKVELRRGMMQPASLAAGTWAVQAPSALDFPCIATFINYEDSPPICPPLRTIYHVSSIANYVGNDLRRCRWHCRICALVAKGR